jgi:hypothetical protein
MDKAQLIYDLERTSLELGVLVLEAKKTAAQLDVSEYALRTIQGDFILAPLLTARANALAALAHLQES